MEESTITNAIADSRNFFIVLIFVVNEVQFILNSSLHCDFKSNKKLNIKFKIFKNFYHAFRLPMNTGKIKLGKCI
ncbi:hypothetical protein DD829_02250 [Chryseobacterium sp. HMWF035]|nr:hypothetical protein DD829_02250 [Chryseobacterium sp. HMWF035]